MHTHKAWKTPKGYWLIHGNKIHRNLAKLRKLSLWCNSISKTMSFSVFQFEHNQSLPHFIYRIQVENCWKWVFSTNSTVRPNSRAQSLRLPWITSHQANTASKEGYHLFSQSNTSLLAPHSPTLTHLYCH